MAKKRLNKKVVIIGSVLFVFLVVLGIAVILYLSQNADKFIKDGDLLLKEARQEKDVEAKKAKYESTARKYHKARSLAKSDSLRVEILFKLADLYLETNEWQNVLGCWNNIIQIDSKNIKARYGKLKYMYIVADSGAASAWPDIVTQTSEFIDLATEVLDEDTTQWESFKVEQSPPMAKRLGTCLYLLRGRAALETVRGGGLTDPNQLLAQSVSDLEKVLELQADNIDAYQYLAEAIVTKGNILASQGKLEEVNEAVNKAKELLEHAVEISNDVPQAHINLLALKFATARSGGMEKIKELEPEYLALVEKFNSTPGAYLALSEFYQLQGFKKLDAAMEALDKAVSLEKDNVSYAIALAEMQYRKSSVFGQKSGLDKAIEIANNALTLPGAQDVPGPRHWVNRSYKAALYTILAKCYIDQILKPKLAGIESDANVQNLLTNAEQSVHQIEQLLGSGEDPRVIKWRGMLELAKGNRNVAVRNLYATYEQIRASIKDPRQMDAQLAYTLAKVFENTSEVGAVTEFLTSALNAGIYITEPNAVLEYADVLLGLNTYDRALSMVDFYEENFVVSQRSRILRIKSYIGANQFDLAAEEMAKFEPDDPNKIKLQLLMVETRVKQLQTAQVRQQVGEPNLLGEKEGEQPQNQLMMAELKQYSNDYAALVDKLLSVEPNSVGIVPVIAVCNNYVKEGKLEQAGNLVEKFLGYFPNHATALVYKQRLTKPDPLNLSQEENKEVEIQALSSITDPAARAMSLGMFYAVNNEPNKAIEELGKVFKVEELLSNTKEKVTDSQRMAAGYLFDMTLIKKDWQLADKIMNIAQRESMDGCEGNFFAARLLLARAEAADNQKLREENYKSALARFNECLKQRPVFSNCYIMRSKINNVLGNEHAAIEDAKKAVSLNYQDGDIARQLAHVLYQRDRKLGDNATSGQMMETKTALVNAMRANPNDLKLLSFYAEYLSDENPDDALALRQRLLKASPSLENAMLLGRLAMRMAEQQQEQKQKQTLFDIAGSAFEQARQIDPNDKTMLANYARYYRTIGQAEKANQLLVDSQDQQLLWQYHFQSGEFEQAKAILEQLYQSQPKNNVVIRGLLLISIQLADKENVKKYSEELLAIEDTLENRIFQIRAFLTVGLVKDTENKLQSLKEQYAGSGKVLLLEAWLKMKQGKMEEAVELINKALEANQEDATAWQLRGEINLFTGNYEQAIIDLKRSKSLSGEPATRISLAKAYLKKGLTEDAVIELKNTIDDPKAPEGSRILLEQTYKFLSRTNDLMEFYKNTLKKMPDSVMWNNRAGEFALALGNVEWAEQLYERAWRNVDKKAETARTIFNGYLWSLLSGKKVEKLFEVAGKYVDGDFAPLAFVVMAEAKIKLGDKETAREYCKKAIDKAGTDEKSVVNILRAMYRLFGAAEVSGYCKEKLEKNPDSLAANFAMFNLAKIDGQYNEAVNYIEKCLRIAGDNETLNTEYSIQKALILQSAYVKTSDKSYLENAIEVYESLLTKMPNNITVLNNLAYLLTDNDERLEKAMEYAERVYKLEPENADYLDTYGYTLYKNGKYKKAEEILNSALQQLEEKQTSAPPEMYEHLGMIKEGLGNKEQAVKAYEQALQAGADRLSEKTKERINNAIKYLAN